MKENNEICYMAYDTRMLDQHAIYLIKRKSKTVKVKTQNSKAVLVTGRQI